MIRACSRVLRSTTSMAWAAASALSRPLASMAVHPSIAVSGVRSSCESTARNSSLARFAASASRRACLLHLQECGAHGIHPAALGDIPQHAHDTARPALRRRAPCRS